MSPTELTLRKLRADGWIPWKVEHWNAFAKIRQDLWGFGDIIAIRPESPHLIVQCTSLSNVSARIKKIGDIAASDLWIATGGVVQVWGWYKEKNKWCVTIRNIVRKV